MIKVMDSVTPENGKKITRENKNTLEISALFDA
jgi:hypothetical protein